MKKLSPPYKHTGTARTKSPAQDVGDRDQGRPGAPLWPASLRWRKDWVKVTSDIAQDRRGWRAFVCDVVESIVMSAQPAPGECPHK